jgi:hypothetical protein
MMALNTTWSDPGVKPSGQGTASWLRNDRALNSHPGHLLTYWVDLQSRLRHYRAMTYAHTNAGEHRRYKMAVASPLQAHPIFDFD